MIRKTAFQMALAGGVLGAALAGLPHAAHAQSADKAVIHTNKTVFNLPVKIDDRNRAGLREIRLYVKSGAADWVQQEAGKPDIKSFSYRVPQDGEYWFSVATVDKAGVSMPADISREPPGLRVLVDTVPPIVELKPVVGPDGKANLKCVLQDANPDFQSLKVSYRMADGREMVLVPEVGAPGTFMVTNPEIWTRPVHVEAKDRCGNLVQHDFQLQNPLAQAGPPPAALPPSAPLPGALPPVSANAMPLHPPSTPLDVVALKPDLPVMSTPEPGPIPPPANVWQTPPHNPLHETPPLQSLPPQQREPAPLPFNDSPPASGITQVAATQTVPNYTAPKSARPADNRRLLNTVRAVLEYRIDDVGPSGVSKVEVWMTGDEGRTWRRLQEDFDRRSPAEVNLPGEGVYGIRLAVTNGNGFGGSPPKSGDEATSCLEIDTTVPFVQLRDIDPLAKNGNLTICWAANDKNMSPEPVSLYYRTRRDGPWQVMAVNLPNSGSYQWAFPRQMGGQFFIRIEVRDEAGNIARAETNEPITLDLAEPRASVVNVTGINGGSPPP